MGSPSSPTLAEPPAPVVPPRLGVLVVGFGDAVAADYADHVRRQDGRVRVADLSDPSAAPLGGGQTRDVVLFLKPRLTERDRQALSDLFRSAGEWGTEFVGVVSTFRVHLGDAAAAETEAHVLKLAEQLPARTVVFRPGHVLSRRSRASVFLRRFGFLYPLMPRRPRSCCVDGGELFVAIETERQRDAARGHGRVPSSAQIDPGAT